MAFSGALDGHSRACTEHNCFVSIAGIRCESGHRVVDERQVTRTRTLLLWTDSDAIMGCAKDSSVNATTLRRPVSASSDAESCVGE